MASGKFDLTDNKSNQWAWVTYEESNPSTANNTSDLTVKVYFRRSNNGYTSDGTMATSVTVDGTTKTASTKFTNSGTADSLVFSQKFTGINHNTNGSKSVTISVTASSTATGFSGSGSQSVALDTIARASVINSFSGNDIEGNFSAVFTSYSTSFTHKLRISIENGNTLQTFNNYTSGANVYLSNENVAYLYTYMESRPTVNLSAVVETWNGSTKIGESTAITNTCSIDNALPIITASLEIDDKTQTLTGNSNTLIKYYSTVTATMSAEAQKGAAIDENLYIIRNGENTGYGTEHTFENVESNEFIFLAEDTRGGVGRKTLTPTMIDYIKLTCNIANNRPDALGNVNIVCNGNYFNDSFGATENELRVQFRYATSVSALGDDWLDMSIAITGNSYIAYADFEIPNFVQTQSYVFETRAIDKLDNISSNSGAVKSTPIFHWGENDFVFEVPVTFNGGADISETSGDFKVAGDLWLKGDGNYGNSIHFGDKSYVSISEPQDDTLRFKATAVTFDTLSFGVYGSPLYDFVVEEGESGSWKYRKWYSGIAECWVTVSMSSAINTAWGGLYRTGTYSSKLDYPFSFISRPREVVTAHCSSSYGLMTYSYDNNTSTRTGSYDVTRPTAVTSALSIYFDIYVIGKWQ
jgi:hypothetical protein